MFRTPQSDEISGEVQILLDKVLNLQRQTRVVHSGGSTDLFLYFLQLMSCVVKLVSRGISRSDPRV